MEKTTIRVRLINPITGEIREKNLEVFKSYVNWRLTPGLADIEEVASFVAMQAIITTLLDIPSNDGWDGEEWYWDEAYTENGECFINF